MLLHFTTLFGLTKDDKSISNIAKSRWTCLKLAANVASTIAGQQLERHLRSASTWTNLNSAIQNISLKSASREKTGQTLVDDSIGGEKLVFAQVAMAATRWQSFWWPPLRCEWSDLHLSFFSSNLGTDSWQLANKVPFTSAASACGDSTSDTMP